jgi:hypothetical protein
MRVVSYTAAAAAAIARIEHELSGQQNLIDLMKWVGSYPAGTFLPTVVSNVVVQDEFTHDVVVPFRDGLVLVYDTT